MAVLLALIVIVIIGKCLERIYRKNWSKGLKVKVRYDRPEAMVDTEVKILEVLANTSKLYLPYIYLKYDITRNGEPINGRSGVFSLLYKQKVTRNIVHRCKRRGCYDIGRAYIVFKGMFLGDTLECQIPQRSRLIVYPKLLDVSEVPIYAFVTEGERVHYQRVLEDRLAFRDIREYTDMDPITRINWNATARADELMVNTYDDVRRSSVRIVMELPDSFYEESEYLQELNISIAASIYVEMLKNKVPVSFISNALDAYTKALVCLPERDDVGFEKEVLESFARIDVLAKDGVADTKLEEGLTAQTTLILISQMGDLSKGLKSSVFELVEAGHRILWIVVASKRDTESVNEAWDKIRSYGWENRVEIYVWE